MEYAIIVAGGAGVRMGSEVPKQFIEIGGLPIVMHTIRRFRAYSESLDIFLVLPETQFQTWHQLCRKHNFEVVVQVVAGGATRFQSVKNGLAAIAAETGEVAIHDGVRPFVSIETIRQSFEVARQKGSAVAAVALKDSIRQVLPGGASQSADRNHYRLVQTPQTFQVKLIKEAFKQPEQAFFTDDASVAEAAGMPIELIADGYENIKVTTPEDLRWAEFALAKR
ncbi:MAG: 2-C-methyl-D-erythritol 4-phosphate cytidylyltransferase [Cytophagales bacterium]|jgi:2-C-methyl-D-erythritol 4-phosphate cytidylyltransferase|nr:2-C-methyl-D-erythritol 4-phosphate cytidylyltransferase [Cytophagales bacterium]